MVMLETKIFVKPTLPLNFPPFNVIDSNKIGIPEPLVSGENLEIMGPTISAPIIGRNNNPRLYFPTLIVNRGFLLLKKT